MSSRFVASGTDLVPAIEVPPVLELPGFAWRMSLTTRRERTGVILQLHVREETRERVGSETVLQGQIGLLLVGVDVDADGLRRKG